MEAQLNTRLTKQLICFVFASFSIARSANAICLQVEGEYSRLDKESGETVLLHIEQKECRQVNAVYDYGDNGKSARIMMFNGRPVIYFDTLEHTFSETYEISNLAIKAHALEIDKTINEEVHTESKIYLDIKRNLVEESRTYTKDHETEAKLSKVVYKRISSQR